MIDNKDGTFVITQKELDDLFNAAEAFKKSSDEKEMDIHIIRGCIMQLLDTLHLTTPDRQHIKPEIVNKTVNPLKFIIKGAGSVMALITAAKFSTDAEMELQEKYSFLDKVTPIIQKYGPSTLSDNKQLGTGKKEIGNNGQKQLK